MPHISCTVHVAGAFDEPGQFVPLISEKFGPVTVTSAFRSFPPSLGVTGYICTSSSDG